MCELWIREMVVYVCSMWDSSWPERKTALVIGNASANSTKHVFKMTPQHQLRRHNGACRHARAKHHQYFIFEKCTKPLLYVDPRLL